MKRRNLINPIKILSGTGIIFSFYLVAMEIANTGFCPGLWGIPACYFVLAAFILVLISSYLKNTAASRLVFYPGSAGGLLMAAWFSYNQAAGLKHCPAILSLPLCFASFFIFLILLILGIMAYEPLKRSAKLIP